MIRPATVLARCLWSLHSVDEFAVPHFENALSGTGNATLTARSGLRIAAANRGWHPGRQYRVGPVLQLLDNQPQPAPSRSRRAPA